jgi:hypothetical protein
MLLLENVVVMISSLFRITTPISLNLVCINLANGRVLDIAFLLEISGNAAEKSVNGSASLARFPLTIYDPIPIVLRGQ